MAEGDDGVPREATVGPATTSDAEAEEDTLIEEGNRGLQAVCMEYVDQKLQSGDWEVYDITQDTHVTRFKKIYKDDRSVETLMSLAEREGLQGVKQDFKDKGLDKFVAVASDIVEELRQRGSAPGPQEVGPSSMEANSSCQCPLCDAVHRGVSIPEDVKVTCDFPEHYTYHSDNAGFPFQLSLTLTPQMRVAIHILEQKIGTEEFRRRWYRWLVRTERERLTTTTTIPSVAHFHHLSPTPPRQCTVMVAEGTRQVVFWLDLFLQSAPILYAGLGLTLALLNTGSIIPKHHHPNRTTSAWSIPLMITAQLMQMGLCVTGIVLVVRHPNLAWSLFVGPQFNWIVLCAGAVPTAAVLWAVDQLQKCWSIFDDSLHDSSHALAFACAPFLEEVSFRLSLCAIFLVHSSVLHPVSTFIFVLVSSTTFTFAHCTELLRGGPYSSLLSWFVGGSVYSVSYLYGGLLYAIAVHFLHNWIARSVRSVCRAERGEEFKALGNHP